jgi:hypothetical protein
MVDWKKLEDERLKRITCCCLKIEHCRRRQRDPEYADCASVYKTWELDWLRELHSLLYTSELSNFYLPETIFNDNLSASTGSPEGDDADTAGVAVKKPKRPNLNSGSASMSLDEPAG